MNNDSCKTQNSLIMHFNEPFLKKKVLIFSDPHGFYKETSELLESETFDVLVMLGDFVDGGGEDEQLFELLKEYSIKLGNNFIWLLGNHEKDLISRYEYWADRKILKPFQIKIAEELITYDLPYLVHFGKEIVLTHGSYRGNDEEKDPDYYLMSRDLIKGTGLSNINELVVCGHTPVNLLFLLRDDMDKETTKSLLDDPRPVHIDTQGKITILPERPIPIPDRGVIDIDTGMKNKGYLTALILENGYLTYKRIRSRYR